MKKATYVLLLLLLSNLFTTAQTAKSGAINISKLIAYEKDNRFYIDWSTDPGTEANYWEVQSSVDGKKFSTIALVLGPDPAKTGEEYGYKGKINEQKPASYFRVVHITAAGAKQESNIIRSMKLESMSLVNPNIKNKIPVLL